MSKIIVDTLGCDNPVSVIVKGVVDSLDLIGDKTVVMSGPKKEIEEELVKYSYDAKRIEILDANVAITNYDSPTRALKEKPDSSLIKAINELKTNDDCVGMVSCGSTGAVLVASSLLLGRIENVSRPTLATILPTMGGKNVCLLDCGANVDCKSDMLVQFAIMGNAAMKAFCGLENPRIGLLNVGTESKKGNQLAKDTYELLSNSSLNFVGNVEAREILNDNVDVIVCDGFDGNIILKNIEGTAKFVISEYTKNLYKNFDKEAIDVVNKALKQTMFNLDFNSRGGANLLGVNKIVVKGHGACNASTIKYCVKQVNDLYDGGLVDKIKANI